MTGKTDSRTARSTKPSTGQPQQRDPEPPVAPAEPDPTVHRAGGWVDRGDGRGWELEE